MLNAYGDALYKAYFVDDEPLVLEEFMNNPTFMECGYQAAGGSVNPLEAEREIRRTGPDVVFIDLKMPGCSGVELMDTLRQQGAGCEFVLVSAYGEFEESRRFFKMDGFDYLIKPVSDHDLQALLHTLSVKIAGKKPVRIAAEATPSPEFNKILLYLHEHLAERHTLEVLSEKFNLNAKYICNLFAGHLGTTFVSYMTRLRMEEAGRLLRETQKSVKEIARLCGYTDYFYFCRIFRDYHACTPTAFREAAQ